MKPKIDLSNEKFIERNIAKLCEEYDKIHGANINLARITPGLIDGLKPVQRRSLYTMFQRDGGKKYRKLASISGEVFGNLHPHCLEKNTEFLLTDGTSKTIEELYKIGGEFEILTYDKKSNCIFRAKMHDVRITKEVSSLVRIHLSTGKDIICTDDHQILIYRDSEDDDKKLTWVFAKDICPGDCLYGGEIIPTFSITNDSIEKTIFVVFSVTNVSEISYDQPEPVYDFTVDEFENAFIIVGNVDDKHLSVVPIHNSTTSIDDAIAGLEQEWHNNIPLIDGHDTNYGSVSGDRHGASRYIQARLSDYAIACFFEDWKYSVVDMVPSFNEETTEPVYLPAKYPNVLLNGIKGIGYGLSSNICSFNFKEIANACIRLMENPNAKIILIPDSPTGCDIIEDDFAKICEKGYGSFRMRCTYEIDDEHNVIRITSLPYLIAVNTIREKIADIKEKGGLSELISMNDLSGKKVDLRLVIRDDVNPYKFMRKLIKEIAGLEQPYAVNITVTNDYESFDYSIKQLLLEWITWRKEQKRVVVNRKRSSLMAEQRTNDVKIFLLNGDNLEKTIQIFRTNRNRKEIEKKLIEEYKHSEIRMDSLQAKALSDMKFYELSIDNYEACLKRREELKKELKEVEEIINTEDGINQLIIGELKDGVKRFGTPRKSNVVPREISVSTKIDAVCILQLSSEGMILRRKATNVDEEPVPTDTNGFAVKVDDDSSFIVIDEIGNHSFIKVKEIPVDQEVPLYRYKRSKDILNGKIVAMLPVDIESNQCCTLISKFGSYKRMLIRDFGPSKKKCMDIPEDDRIIRGIITNVKSEKDLLIYTKEGMGQRLNPNNIRITSQFAKGSNGFKLKQGDEIVGCYRINPIENQYILYVTMKGKMRLNRMEYLPVRDNKHDSMVRLIQLNDRDKLVAVVGCNKLDQLQVFYDDGTSEVVKIEQLEEGTMSSEPKKVTEKNAVSSKIVKVKLI